MKVPLATWFVVFVCVCFFSPSFCCFTTLRCCQCPIAQGESRNRSLVIYSLRRCVLKRRFPETPKGFISRNTSPYSNLYIQTYSYSYFKSTAVFSFMCVSFYMKIERQCVCVLSDSKQRSCVTLSCYLQSSCPD